MRKKENKIYTINNDEHLLTEIIFIAWCHDFIEIYLHLWWNNGVGIQNKQMTPGNEEWLDWSIKSCFTKEFIFTNFKINR